jgi:hypothetical protein
VLQSGQKLTLGLLATITLEVAHSNCKNRSQCFCYFSNSFRMSCSVRVISTAPPPYHSALITSIMSKWWPFSFTFIREKQWKVGWGTTMALFLVKNFLVKNEVWDIAFYSCNSQFFCFHNLVEIFIHFHTVSINRHSSMQNWHFGLPGRILYEPLMSKKIMNIFVTSLFARLSCFDFGEFGLFHWEDYCFVSGT